MRLKKAIWGRWGSNLMEETLRPTKLHLACSGQSQAALRLQGTHPGGYLMLWVLALASSPGCDSSSFVPSRPPELVNSPVVSAPTSGAASSSAARPVAPAGVKTAATTDGRSRVVELILARPADLDRSYLELFLRRDTGFKKAAFRIVSPKEGESMSRTEVLASQIREAAKRSTGVVMLEPADVPEVREALRDAEAKSLPIVLLDSTLPASSAGKPYPFVTFKGFNEAAKQLVETVFDDARILHLPADGTTLVIENRDKDSYSRDRLESITAALKAAGKNYDTPDLRGPAEGGGRSHPAVSRNSFQADGHSRRPRFRSDWRIRRT